MIRVNPEKKVFLIRVYPCCTFGVAGSSEKREILISGDAMRLLRFACNDKSYELKSICCHGEKSEANQAGSVVSSEFQPAYFLLHKVPG